MSPEQVRAEIERVRTEKEQAVRQQLVAGQGNGEPIGLSISIVMNYDYQVVRLMLP